MKKRTFLKILSLTLAVLVVTVCFTCIYDNELSLADEGGGVADPLTLWSDTVPATLAEREALWPSYYSVNAGTEEDPYIISNASQLALFAKIVSEGTYTGVKPQLHTNSFYGKYIKLTADIDLAGKNWMPIGISSTTTENQRPFLGFFDGGFYNENGVLVNHYQIQNLTINTSASSYPNTNYSMGLFAYIGSVNVGSVLTEGTVKNLSFTNVGIQANFPYVGTVSGVCAGKIQNCFVLNGSVENTSVTNSVGNTSAGGITGISRFSDIDNCINYSTVSCYYLAGGIVGNAQCSTIGNEASGVLRNALISNCINYGSVGGREAGGIAARSDGAQSSINGAQTFYKRVGNAGDIYGTQKGTATSGIFAGGIIGYAMSGAVWGSYNEGKVSSLGTSVPAVLGGLFGDYRIAVQASYSTGDVIIPSTAGSKSGALFGEKTGYMTGVDLSANYYVLSNPSDPTIASIAYSNYSASDTDKNMYNLMSSADFTSGIVSRFSWNNAKDGNNKPYWYFITGSKPLLTIATVFVDVNYDDGETNEYDGTYKAVKIAFYTLSGASAVDDSYDLKIYQGTSESGTLIKEKTFTSEEITDSISILTESNIMSVGNYYITISLKSVNNYAVEGYSFILNTRDVYIKPDSLTATYGSSVTTFDGNYYEIINESERILSGDTVSGVLSRQSGNNVGTYNYIFESGNPLRVTTSGVENTNYNLILIGSATYRIDKKELTPTINQVTIDYGSTLEDIQSNFKNYINLSASGIISGDTVTVQDASLISAVEAAGSVSAGTYAGDISVVANSIYLDNVSSMNYRINYDDIVAGDLWVRKAVLTVSAVNSSDKKELNSEFNFLNFSYTITGFKYNDTVSVLALENPLYTYFESEGAASAALEGAYNITLSASTPNAFTNYEFNLSAVVGEISVVATITVVSLESITIYDKIYDGTTAATYDAASVVWHVNGILNESYFTGPNTKPTLRVIFSDHRANNNVGVIVSIEKPELAEYVLEQWQITSGYSADISKLAVKMVLGTSTMPYGNAKPADGFEMIFYYNQNGLNGEFSTGDLIEEETIISALNTKYYVTATASATTAFRAYAASEQSYSLYSSDFVLNTAVSASLGDNFTPVFDMGVSGELYITKRILTAPTYTISNKYYDGTTSVPYTELLPLSGTFVLGTVACSLVGVYFNSAEAGEVTCTITSSNLVLTGSASANYQIAPTETQVYTATINKRSLRFAFTSPNFDRNYGYAVNLDDFAYVITDLSSSNQTFINEDTQITLIRSGITIYSSVSGVVPVSTGNKLIPVIGEYDNFYFLSSNIGTANLNIIENIISYPTFLDTAKTYTFGDSISVPDAYIDGVKLSINSGVTYQYEYLYNGISIERSEIRNAGTYNVNLIAIPKAGYGFSQGESKKTVYTTITINKKIVNIKAPNYESQQGVSVDIGDTLSVRNLVCDGLVGFDGNEVWTLSTGARVKMSVPEAATGATAGSYAITLSIPSGTLTANNYTAVFSTTDKGELTVTAADSVTLTSGDSVIVQNVFDSSVTLAVTTIDTKNCAAVIEKINTADNALREVYSAYQINLIKDGAAYVSDLNVTFRMKAPSGEYKDLYVYEVLANDEYRLVSTTRDGEYFVFNGNQSGTFIIAGTKKSQEEANKDYILYGGIAAILFATVIALLLARKTGPNKSAKKGKKENEKPQEKITSKNWTPAPALANAQRANAAAGAQTKRSAVAKPVTGAVKPNAANAQQKLPNAPKKAVDDGIPMLDFSHRQHTPVASVEPEKFVPIISMIDEPQQSNEFIPILSPEEIDQQSIVSNIEEVPVIETNEDNSGFLAINPIEEPIEAVQPEEEIVEETEPDSLEDMMMDGFIKITPILPKETPKVAVEAPAEPIAEVPVIPEAQAETVEVKPEAVEEPKKAEATAKADKKVEKKPEKKEDKKPEKKAAEPAEKKPVKKAETPSKEVPPAEAKSKKAKKVVVYEDDDD